MLVSNKLFGGESPNGVQLEEFSQNMTKQAKVHIVCSVNPVRNSITRNNRVQKRANFPKNTGRDPASREAKQTSGNDTGVF